jgi:hypothetical protein
MRAVRFVKAEYAELVLLLKENTGPDNADATPKRTKLLGSVLAKLEDANGPKQASGVNIGPLESALVSAARGKVVPTVPGGYARASRQALLLGATLEQMGEVGRWLSVQRWLTNPVTIIGVLNKWPDWYPKAHASMPPKGTQEGLGNAKPPAGFR